MRLRSLTLHATPTLRTRRPASQSHDLHKYNGACSHTTPHVTVARLITLSHSQCYHRCLIPLVASESPAPDDDNDNDTEQHGCAKSIIIASGGPTLPALPHSANR
ncbi:hypothetical protein DFH09DRAFT_1353219 [Mycena vulgaris]|nr:hypothetical protein DFH09DRAFT_1353219 [Mycena vulgaris]